MKSHDNSNNNIPIIIVNNKENITDEQKAEALANCFQSVCSDQNYDQSFLETRKSFVINNKNIKMKQNTESSILDEDFNIQELLHTVKSLKNTAPGHDNITKEIIKHLSVSSLMVLLDFYNFSWNQGKLPDDWKLSIIPIHKKDKNKHDAKSYFLNNKFRKNYGKIS